MWWLALCTMILLSILYILRCIFYFDMVKAEFLHHVGVNYLFAPSISGLLLLQSVPFLVPETLSYQVIWSIFVIPVVILDVKIYGQWFTTEKRFLSLVANPTSQMSVIAVCVFTVGAAHYLILFITLYQRLSGADHFPSMLRLVFFLFVAAPSTANLVCRPALFKKSMRRYNVAWWAYSFPLTFLSLAWAEYAQQIKGFVAPGLMLVLSAISVLVFLGLMVYTALNAHTLLMGIDPILGFTSDSGTT